MRETYCETINKNQTKHKFKFKKNEKSYIYFFKFNNALKQISLIHEQMKNPKIKFNCKMSNT